MKKTHNKATLVVNDSAPAAAHNYITLTANRAGMVRNDQMEGQDYLVVPMVMAVEGVLNGSTGPLYYPAAELGKVPQVWDHKPVVVYHPTMNGGGVSACSPEMITTRKIGVIMNTKFEDGKLKAEAWLNQDRAEIVDNRVTEAIDNDTMLELSTGLYTDIDPTAGEFNGTAYVGIARNHAPDHLAILPDKTGACSMADGAGFLRLNEAQDEIKWAAMKSKTSVEGFLSRVVNRGMSAMGFVDNELSHDAIHSQLRDLIRARINPNDSDKLWVWVERVFDKFFVYEVDSDGQPKQFYKLGYTVANDLVTISDDEPQAVVRVEEFRTTDGSFVSNQTTPNNKELVMDKTKVVNGLIENGAWSEDDRQFLLALNEDQLTKLGGSAEDEDAAPAAVPTPTAAPAAVAPAAVTENTVAEYLENAPEALRPVLLNMQTQYEAAKADLVATITANTANTFTAEALNAKDTSELQQIAAFAKTVAPTLSPLTAPTLNFAGATNGAPVAPAADAVVTPLVAPTLNWDV